MADDLTIPLGENGGKGYNVYKYLPYGQIKEVVPYLLRRAQENADVLGKSKYEMELLFDELKDRCRIL
jgi:proline dehydrogenase